MLLCVITEREDGCSGPGHPSQDPGSAWADLLKKKKKEKNPTFHSS